MKTRTEPRRRHAAAPVTVRTAGWITAGLLFATAALGPAARSAAAASVNPTAISDDKNPTCAEVAPAGASWTEFKLEGTQLADGTYSNGTITVTISNYSDSSSGTPGSFDWAADQGVDAIVVKAGSSKHNLYFYDPEATSDEGLAPQAGTGNGISHFSFCYDADALATATPTTEPNNDPTDPPSSDPTDPPSSDPTDPPSSEPSDEPSTSPSSDPSSDPSDPPSSEPSDDPTTQPTDEPTTDPTDPPTVDPTDTVNPTDPRSVDPTDPPSVDPTDTVDPTDSPADPTDDPGASPTSEVLGATSGAMVTPPPTDTLVATAATGQVESWRIVAIGLAMVIISLLLMPARPARSRARR